MEHPVDMNEFESFVHSATNHPPTEQAIDRHERAKDAALEFYSEILCCVPAGRERVLVRTKIEEALMWARKGIAINQENL